MENKKKVIRITESRLAQIVKEEFQKKLTEKTLKAKLRQINEALEDLGKKDECGLEEVEVQGMQPTKSEIGIPNASQPKPVFQKKGSHLIEGEEDGGNEIEIMDDKTEKPAEIGSEEITDELDIDSLLSQLSLAIEKKIEDTVETKIGEGGEVHTEPDGDEGGTIEDIKPEETPAEEDNEDKGIEAKGEEDMDENTIKEQDNGAEAVVNKIEPKNSVPFDNGKASIPDNSQKDKGMSESVKKPVGNAKLLAEIKRSRQMAGLEPLDE